MSDTARQSPKFPWDCDVPDSVIWNSLEYPTALFFLSCYTEKDTAQMTFDESLTEEEKLKHLRSILSQTLEAKMAEVAPASLSGVDHASWRDLEMALGAMEHALRNLETCEIVDREVYQNGPDGGKDMSALHGLSGLLEESGRYAKQRPQRERSYHGSRDILCWVAATAYKLSGA